MLNYEYPPIGGGAANATANILSQFAKNPGLEVDLITSSPNKSRIDHISNNIRIHRLDVNKKHFQHWTEREIILYSLHTYQYIKKMKKQIKYDLIHAFFGIPCGLIAYCFRKELPYIISLRGSDVPGFSNRFKIQYIPLRPIVKHIWRNASRVVSNSTGLAILAHKTSNKVPIDVIPNGVDINSFTPVKRTREEKIQLICVSRLIPRKGIDTLIRATQIILKQFTDFNIIIAGDGKLENSLKKLCNDLGVSPWINFIGPVNHEHLPSLYQNSDIFVLLSDSEGMSNSVLEAMSSGLPILTTNVGGTSELIQGNGIVIPPQSPHLAANALLELIKNSETRHEMGKKSRKISEKMTWEPIAKKYLDLYYRIARAGSNFP